ncbi:FAD-binding domain-containing protein [Cucurbitaria berberidis CBS 394.84]|uniref:FAD-binding domain-containing protein n=1 Tax=Cucurbitaria berberidis CBS 394.84 TaxID=1168544 RepID=A0A9P4GSD0_9PLEO|nr:FAD-binding domain-containing protein [Cucurbitaria berberidis CBS 394.84]KAF1850181.1 FAD-binding domain-containing protein [Cucurbitaria berberidis CBS 394.84]
MKFLAAFLSYLSSSFVLASATEEECKCIPASSCWPADAEWSSLNTTLNGTLIRGVPPGAVCYPDQPSYDEEACTFVASQWFNSTWHAANPVSVDYPLWTNNSCNPIWPNGTSLTGDVTAGARGCSIGAYPAYVVNSTAPEQVAVALMWADKHNLRVVVKSTGHSLLGRSIGYGSLSIWTHHLRGIDYIEDFKPTSCPIDGKLAAARIAAGHTGVEVHTELSKHSAIVVTGANPDVGLVGWLTGGGHGPLSRTYGMGADNLLEATIVTPDGKKLLANPCKHSDIFFAIRGGGGGFIHAEMPRLKDGGMQGYYYVGGLPIVPSLSFQWSFYLYDKPNGTVERLMAPVEEYLKDRGHLFAHQSNITHADTYFDYFGAALANEQVATGGIAIGSRLLSARSLSDPNATAKVFANIGPSTDPLKPNAPVTNPLFIGHMIAHPDIPTYYPDIISMNPAWRNTIAHFIVVSTWQDGMPQPVIDSVYKDITYNKTEALRKLSPETGAYFNEADSYEPGWQQSFFGEHYDRLKAIKEKYDPHNVLWCRRCVGSEALVEQPDGRLCAPRYEKGLFTASVRRGNGIEYTTRGLVNQMGL